LARRIAGLLYDLHRETVGDGWDLIWTLAQFAETTAGVLLEDVAV
jgi:hypothetical protein